MNAFIHTVRYAGILLLIFCPCIMAQSDSVDVTFRYKPSGSPSLVHLAAEFNNWANNSSGTISPDPIWTMTKQTDGTWEKTVRLKVHGGGGPGGSYEYKFNENGSSSGWLADPLNPRTYGSYGNSILYVTSPTIFHIQPVRNSIVTSASPVIYAEIFPSVGTVIDTTLSFITARGLNVGHIGAGYDAVTYEMTFRLPAMSDGDCSVSITAVDSKGGSSNDSTRFTIRAAPLQWLSRDNPNQPDSSITLFGVIHGTPTSDVIVVRNGTDSTTTSLADTIFSCSVRLTEGRNAFVSSAVIQGILTYSDTLTITHLVDHKPKPRIMLGSSGAAIGLNAYASSDPDNDPLEFEWRSEDERNPTTLGIAASGAEITFPRPDSAGEYYFKLTARDPQGNTGVARSYLTLTRDSVYINTVQSNPSWVRDAIIYEIFVPSFSPSKNLAGIVNGLPAIRSLGVNTLWLMPIFDNNGSINELNGGYDIVDFFNIEPSLGTLADFRTLVDSCHASGIRIILDITPNHVSDQHPWVNDIRTWGDYSIYRPFIEKRILGDDRGLGQTVLQYNGYPLYSRYSNWGLANLNLSNQVTREAMSEVFHFWVDSMKADGFRMDVYWGPQNRYGAGTFWGPFRNDIKRSKPEIFVLGETDATGTSTELNFADTGGACDAAYDWNLFNQIRTSLSTGDINTLHNRIINYSPDGNYNYWTGPDAHYMRFMENHDETRIAQVFASGIERTMPGAVLLMTAPGIPMIYAGQEIGWKGRRDPIDFAYGSSSTLLPYYARLVEIRKRFPALRSPRLTRLSCSTPGVYAFIRSYSDENIIVLINFNSQGKDVSVQIDEKDLLLSNPLVIGKTYYLNDVLAQGGVTWAVGKNASTGTVDFASSLTGFSSRIMVLSDSAWSPAVEVEHVPEGRLPDDVTLGPVYPTPVVSSGTVSVEYGLPADGALSTITLSIYDMLGRRLAHIQAGEAGPGRHSIDIRGTSGWTPRRGVYILQLTASCPGARTRMASCRLIIE